MYEIDGICYAGTPDMPIEEILVVDAVPLNGGMLLVTFSTGEKSSSTQQALRDLPSSHYKTRASSKRQQLSTGSSLGSMGK